MVYSELSAQHFISHLILSDKQYYFRFTKSTSDTLTIITEYVYQSLHKNGEAQAVALDMSKAFYSVWHAGILHKFKCYGVTTIIFDLTIYLHCCTILILVSSICNLHFRLIHLQTIKNSGSFQLMFNPSSRFP